MADLFTGGKLGELFAALSIAGALVATLSFFLAEFRKDRDKKGWESLGKIGFWTHAVGVLGVISTLFYLIYSHQYQYHYVWSHSSNELPVYYMISCFWEGQEGSFLLWSFWHTVLGGIMLFVLKGWRNIVLSVISSVELILSSMVLGVYIPETIVWGIYLALLLIPAAYLVHRFVIHRRNGLQPGVLHIASSTLAIIAMALLFTGNSGYQAQNASSLLSAEGFPFLVFGIFRGTIVFGLALAILNIQIPAERLKESGVLRFSDRMIKAFAGEKRGMLNGFEVLSALFLVVMAIVVAIFSPSEWKLGSSPFILLKDAMPDMPVWGINPDFVPANGTGLNPLLQNYWMVIHPPTLFLGFASTVVPFAFVIGGLVKGKYAEWVRPATAWTVFSVMILGVGIIMGGYWAYETLSFGGYWNWDPVENASFVPWLTGIAAVHMMLVYRKTRSFLELSMALVILTFLLVLYSTFLTRSGILGEASVHTFTDLGLSGQLLVLLFFYFGTVTVLWFRKWHLIPSSSKEIKFWSSEFLLFLGTLVLLFSGLGITLATSLPVINKIFGTNLAPPVEVQFFYYRWNVWFAVLFGILSGMGQFLWWLKAEKKTIFQSLFIPFLTAIVLTSGLVVGLAISGWDFAYDLTYFDWLEKAGLSDSVGRKINYYFRFSLFAFADELLLASALFTIVSNAITGIRIVKRNRKSLKAMGGSLAHIGFGLMLVGMLFSSGYDSIVSENINPAELEYFNNEKEQGDNVLLLKGQPRLIKDYVVTYVGKKEAIPPVSKVSIIEEEGNTIKVRFRDKTDDEFVSDLPRSTFLSKTEKDKVDMARLQEFLDENIEFLKPDHINKRSLFGLHFIKAEVEKDSIVYDSSQRFLLFPEAEVNPGMGLIAHPSRQIFADKDLYVHISTIPKNDEFIPEFKPFRLRLGIGDTASIDTGVVYLKGITPLERTDDFEISVRADIELYANGKTYSTSPVYRINSKGQISPKSSYISQTATMFYFTEIDPVEGKMGIEISQQVTFPDDYVVIKAIHKPWINILWLGTFVLVAGFLLSIYRRATEKSDS